MPQNKTINIVTWLGTIHTVTNEPRLRLANGKQILVRPIQDSDRAHLDAGIRKLSPQSRWLRFHTDRTEFSAEELTYLVECDGVSRLAMVAIGLDDDGNESEGIGVARAYRNSEQPESAEVAIVVIDEWQQLGVGHALLHTLAETCISIGVRQWTAQILMDNDRALHLFQACGEVVHSSWEQGVQDVVIHLKI